jgi:uncharacterized membrane-anchored protein
MQVGRKRGHKQYVGHPRTKTVKTNDANLKPDDAMMKALAKGDKELVMTVHENKKGGADGMEMKVWLQKHSRGKEP